MQNARKQAIVGRDWLELATFTWLISEDIVSEYKDVLTRLGVRRNLVGEVINLLREEAEFVDVRVTSDASPDPDDSPFLCMCGTGAGRVHCNFEPEGLPPEEVAGQGDLAWRPDPHNTKE